MSYSAEPVATLTARSPACSEEEFVTRFAYLFGESEMFVSTSRHCSLGALIRFELHLADGRLIFRGTGRIVAVRHEAGGVPGVTIHFDSLCLGSLNLLGKIMEYQRGEKTPVAAIDPRLLCFDDIAAPAPASANLDVPDEIPPYDVDVPTSRISRDECDALLAVVATAA